MKKGMWVLTILIVIPVVFVSASGYFSTATSTSPPNVVLISIDSLRADRLGVYGYEREVSPNIDAWAKDSVVFDNYYSASYLTPISEAAVHTGKYPFTNGIINFELQLASGTPMLAEILHKRGWVTGAFLSSPEFVRPALRKSFQRGFVMFSNDLIEKPIAWNGRKSSPVPNAINWMRDNATGEKPFFVYIAIGSVHWPYGFDEPDHFSDAKYNGILKTSFDFIDKKMAEVHAVFDLQYGHIFDGKQFGDHDEVVKNDVTEDLAYLNGRYDDGVLLTDRTLKDLFEFLALPEMRNTIVILQSEHGEELGEKGYISHYDITDNTTHVPLIIHAPSLKGSHVDVLVSGVDVAPTLLQMLRMPEEAKDMDGVSVLSYLKGDTSHARTEVFLARTPLWERLLQPYEPWLTDLVSEDNVAPAYDMGIRSKEWKLIHRLARDTEARYSWYGHLTKTNLTRPEYQLYDLKNDPGETQDVYESHKTEPDVVALQSKLTEWEVRMVQFLPAKPQAPEMVQPYF